MVPKQMKAVIFEQYGDADVLKYTDFRVPTLERGEALVKVHAVSLNGYDLMARAGRYKPNKGKFVQAIIAISARTNTGLMRNTSSCPPIT